MSCTNDPLVLTIPSTQTTTMELQCTPYGNATLTFFSNTLNNVSMTFKCNDTTPRISGVRRVLSQEFEILAHSQTFIPNTPPRKAHLYIPYDTASVVDPSKLSYRTIVDPVGWQPVPTDYEKVYDASGTRLIYVKIPSVSASGRYVVVEEN